MTRPTGEAIDAVYEEFTTDNGPETSLTQRRYVFRTEDLCVALIEARADADRLREVVARVRALPMNLVLSNHQRFVAESALAAALDGAE